MTDLRPKLPITSFFLRRFGKSSRAYFLGLVLLFVHMPWPAQCVVAQTQSPAKLEIGHDFWGFKDNAPVGAGSLAQTSDGFLWIGTDLGLYRFDGTRFELYHSSFGDQLLSTNIHSLFAPPSGGLWIGYTFGGFSFLNDGRVTNYGGEIASSMGSVHNFAQNTNGVVWAATTSGLWKFDHSHWQHIGPEANVPPGDIREARFDQEGTLWAVAGVYSSVAKLLYLRPGSSQFQTAATDVHLNGLTLDADRRVVTSPESKQLLDKSRRDSDDVPSAYPVLRSGCTQIVDRTQSVWIMTVGKIVLRRDARGRLFDALTSEPPPKSESYSLNSFSSLVDREGSIWFGEQGGVHRFFYTPLIRQELPKYQPRYFAVAPDEDGAVWITAANVNSAPPSIFYHVRNGQVRLRKAAGGLMGFLYRSPDKTFWFGGQSGLWHLVGADLIRVDLPKEMADQSRFLQTITQDRQGGLWVSFGRHGLYRVANGVWTSYGGREDLPKTGVVIEFTDSRGRVWFGYTNSQLAVLDGDHVQVFGSNDGIRVGNITAIYGRGSEIWIGGEFGLEQFDHGSFHNIQATDSELLRGISGIVETANGDLWLNGLGGIFHVPRSEIIEALKNSVYQVKGEHFGTREGLPGYPFQLRPLNTAIEGTDGRIWFATSGGIVWLDPARTKTNVPPPPITIQSVSADDKSYPLGSELKFPARTSSVQISYAAISLLDPAAIRFRYTLQESDKDWHEVPSASPVSYRNLAPGSYLFSVMATDTNGVWSDKVATAEFAILPAFYQTRWFLLLCVAAALMALYLLYLLRLRQVEHQFRVRMDERVNERTRIARELHDTLLQSFHGVMFQFQAARNMLRQEPEKAAQALDDAILATEEAIGEGRDAIRGLRHQPVDLARLLNVTGKELAAKTNESSPTFRVVVEGEPRTLEPMLQDEVYRIAREVIRNAFRHALAHRIEAEVRYDEQGVRLRVRDDGKGIDKEVLKGSGREGHWGLPGVRERAKQIGARLDFWSEAGAGTEVELTVPAEIAYRDEGDDDRSRPGRKGGSHEQSS
jgi:ligand-binding sensor domain-containing protein/signal transduction histidine kinase